MADPLRRRLLVNLMEHNPQDIPESLHVGERELEALRIELVHLHFPKLEDAGFIQWNQAANEVVKGPHFDEIQPLLSLVDGHSDELPYNWPEGE